MYSSRLLMWSLGVLALIAHAATLWLVYHDKTTTTAVWPWLASIVFALAAFLHGIPRLVMVRERLARGWPWLLFAAGLPVLVRLVLIDAYRTHDDEFITAFFSQTEPVYQGNFFEGLPRDASAWVCQFPKMFFALQKPWFKVFGTSPYIVKTSILPYVAVCGVLLFLLVKRWFGLRTAIAAVVLASFQSFSIYLETMGFHFISSTAIFLAMFSCAMLYWESDSIGWAGLAGLACGFCYLFYTSSYLAVPVLAVILLFHAIRHRSLRSLAGIGLALAGFVLVFAPFLLYHFKWQPYFLGRIDQVNLATGSWSSGSEAIRNGASVSSVYFAYLGRCLQSLVIDGIGGHGGYDFGNRALFDTYTLVLLGLGTIAGIWFACRRFRVLYVFMVIVVTFVIGMAFTAPPPAYHRFGLALPFVAILLSLPFAVLFRIPRIPARFINGTATVLLLLFAILQVRYFNSAVARERPHDEMAVSDLINRQFPGRKIYIAAFPHFAFEKNYFFSAHRNGEFIYTEYHRQVIEKIDHSSKYVILIHSPYELGVRETIWEKVFLDTDPNARIISLSDKYSLMVN